MAAPALSTMRGNVQLLIQDTNTSVAPALTTAQYTTFINLALRWWYENTEKRIKAVTAIATVTVSSYEQDGDATFLYPEILGAYLDLAGAATDVVSPMRRCEWNAIKDRQKIDGTPGTPRFYAAQKYGAAGVGASAQNKWRFAFWQVPDDADVYTLKATVRDYPTALSADADIVDLGDFEANCVEIIAAIFAAPRIGRPELAEDLMGLLPKMIQDKLDTHRSKDEAIA